MTGLGDHYGGSCQVSFSVDKGTTFQVATTFEGDCPHRGKGIDPAAQTFDFTVPADIPTGDVIFAWSVGLESNKVKRLTKTRTWFNREKEFNMNCAAVTIASPTDSVTTPTVPYSKRPGPLIADIPDPDNGCWTVKDTAEVKYPNPGPDVVQGDGMYPLALPTPADKCGY